MQQDARDFRWAHSVERRLKDPEYLFRLEFIPLSTRWGSDHKQIYGLSLAAKGLQGALTVYCHVVVALFADERNVKVEVVAFSDILGEGCEVWLRLGVLLDLLEGLVVG